MNKQYEKLIQLIINEDIAKADKLFHQIVVEHSKRIYESLLEDETEVGDLMADVEAEQEGLDTEDDIDSDIEGDDGDETIEADESDEDEEIDLGDEDEDEPASEEDVEEIEDRVIDLEDKIDELMAQFEEMMASDDGDESAEDETIEGDDDTEETPDEVEDEDFDVESEDESEEDETPDEEIEGEESEEDLDKQAEQLAEAYLRQVAAQHLDGSDSSARKSPVASNSGKIGMAGKPVRLGQDGSETGRVAPTAEVMYKSPKNAAGGSTGKLESAPRATNSQASGVNTKSIMSESLLDEAMDDSIVQGRATLKPILSKYGLNGAFSVEKKKGIRWPIVSLKSGSIDFINNAANTTKYKNEAKEIIDTQFVEVIDIWVKATFTGKAASALNEIFDAFADMKGYGKLTVRIGPKDGYECTGTPEPLKDEVKQKLGLSESRKRKVR